MQSQPLGRFGDTIQNLRKHNLQISIICKSFPLANKTLFNINQFQVLEFDRCSNFKTCFINSKQTIRNLLETLQLKISLLSLK